jgi:hypothetical protein
MSPNRNLYTELRDAAGNERGANITAANALKVDGSAVTQPVSDAGGSLTVDNAGVFAVQDSSAESSLNVIDDWDESDRAKVNPIVGQAGVSAGTGIDDAGTQRVSLATDVPLPTGTNSIGQISDITTSVTPGTGAGNLAKGLNGAPAATDDAIVGIGTIVDTAGGSPPGANSTSYYPLALDGVTRQLKAAPGFIQESLGPFVANSDTFRTISNYNIGEVGPQTALSVCMTSDGSIVAATITIVVEDINANQSATVITLSAADLGVLKGVTPVIPFVRVRGTLSGLTFGTGTEITVYVTTAP